MLAFSCALPGTVTPRDGPYGSEGASTGDRVLATTDPGGPRADLAPGIGHFTRNDGQLGRDDVRFYSTGSFRAGFTDRGLVMDIRGYAGGPLVIGPEGDRTVRGVLVELVFVGGNERAPRGLDPLPHPTSFFLGSDPSGWVTAVPSYRRVIYEEVWDDIDIEFLGGPRGLKYNVHIRPGGDVRDVGFGYRGLDGLVVEEQRLVLRTALGDIVDSDLLMFQDGVGGMSEVPGMFVPTGPSSVGFRVVGSYDEDRELVVDPNLTYSTYVGSRNTDWCEGIALGPDGSAYLTGTTNSFHFPVTPGAYQQENQRGRDGYVLRMDPEGRQLMFSTYLGGSWRDNLTAIGVDCDGNAYVAGETDSDDFPVTDGAYDTTFNGETDGVVLKLNSTGSDLLFSTYIGNAQYDIITDMALDSSDRTFITGYTESWDFPVTAGAFCTTFNGQDDAFVVKLATDGSTLEYSTLVGGTDSEYSYAIAVDDSGNAYLTGMTLSYDFPTTTGAFQTVNNQPINAFVVKLEPDGTALAWSTFLGGGLIEFGFDLALDGDRNVYVIGDTNSEDFPTTADAYKTTFDGGYVMFITKLDADGAGLNFSTYVGDTGGGINDFIRIAVGPDRSVFFASDFGMWGDFPTTPGAFNTKKSGMNDIVFGRMSADGRKLMYSSFLGGIDNDYISGIAIDGSENIYVCGRTDSLDFPVTSGVYSETFLGEGDAFIVKADVVAPALVSNLTPETGTNEEPFTISARVRDNVGIESVDVVYGFGDDDETRGAMNNTTTDPDVYSLTLPGTSFHPTLHYHLEARDLAGNLLTTDRCNVTLLDHTPPRFLLDMTPGSGTTGDRLVFAVNVTDNIGVDRVSVEYWSGDGEHVNLSMVLEADYTRSITVPPDSIEDLSYVFAARDASDNWNSTSVSSIGVTDDDRPVFDADLSEVNITGEVTYGFVARWAENVAIQRASVVHWFFDDGSNVTNASMSVSGGPGAFLCDGPLALLRPLEPICYYYEALDSSGNWNRTPELTFNLYDDEPPGIVRDMTDGEATTGDAFRIAVEVVDDTGVRECQVRYWFDGWTPRTEVMGGHDLTGKGNGTYSYEIQVPATMRGSLHYEMVLVDVYLNRRTTGTVHVEVRDNDPPVISDDGTGTEGVKGLDLLLEVRVEDNLNVSAVHVEVDTGPGEAINLTMERGTGAWTVAHHIDRHSASELGYRFSAVDEAGNWAARTEWRFVPLVNLAPELGPLPVWSVVEGVGSELDLEPYISDGNDPVADIVVRCDDANVTVEGRTLLALFEVWRANLTIVVRISDGEDEVLADIPVHVTDVNDPPSLPVIISPANGTRVMEGENVTFEVLFDDPDLVEGQVLTIEWMSSISGQLGVLTTEGPVGPMVRSDLGPGRHEITVTVSDGEFERSSWTVVKVRSKVEPSKGPDWYQWLLMAAVVVLIVLATVIIYRRR